MEDLDVRLPPLPVEKHWGVVSVATGQDYNRILIDLGTLVGIWIVAFTLRWNYLHEAVVDCVKHHNIA